MSRPRRPWRDRFRGAPARRGRASGVHEPRPVGFAPVPRRMCSRRTARWGSPLLEGCLGVIVSPHLAGDFVGRRSAPPALFVENYRRWCRGKPLLNVVDKTLGYVPSTHHRRRPFR